MKKVEKQYKKICGFVFSGLINLNPVLEAFPISFSSDLKIINISLFKKFMKKAVGIYRLLFYSVGKSPTL